jgi:hypothetical protein
MDQLVTVATVAVDTSAFCLFAMAAELAAALLVESRAPCTRDIVINDLAPWCVIVYLIVAVVVLRSLKEMLFRAGRMEALHLAVALALLGAAAAAPALGRTGAEFSPSIVLTNMGEMGQPCHQMVQRAIATNARSIKFVPTVHYYGSETHIDRFCLR